MNFSVRPYIPSDLGDIQCLTAKLWPVPIEQDFFWASTPKEGSLWPVVWVAEQGGQVVGFTRLDKNEFLPSGTLAFVVVNVHPDAQSEGIGQALAERAEAYAIAHGQTTLRTSARNDLPRLTSFWRIRGFDEVMRGGPLMVWKSVEVPDATGLSFESLCDFLSRADADHLLEAPFNRWNRLIHEGLPFPAAGHISGEDWLEVVQETADLERSLVAWENGNLRAFVTFYAWEGKPDELALNLDGTLDVFFENDPNLQLFAIAYAMDRAFSSGIRRIVFEAQPHFPWAVSQLQTLSPEIFDRPVWVLMDKQLNVPEA